MRETYARRETYATDRGSRTMGGGCLLAVISLVAAIAVIAGLAYARGVGERRKVLLAAGGCAPLAFQPTGLECTSVDDLISQYKAITTPAIQQLNADKAAYIGNQFRNFAAAKLALKAQVALEKQVDAKLAKFSVPVAAAPAMKALIQADEALARLQTRQAQALTPFGMRSFNPQVNAASDAVKAANERLLKALDQKPTPAQEP